MKIYVTQDHINRGLKSDCARCPVALALGEALNLPHNRISVDPDEIWVGGEGVIETPPEVANFVYDFDEGKLVHPFEFDLEFAPPDEDRESCDEREEPEYREDR